MPFIIWGSRGVTSNLESGRFYCPNCDAEADYYLKQTRPFFTLFFIPIFPTGQAQRYVQCGQCGQTYLERVLHMRPGGEPTDTLHQLQNELRTGSSIQTIEKKLALAGFRADQTEDIVKHMTRGETWTCPGCGETYLKEVGRCLHCPG